MLRNEKMKLVKTLFFLISVSMFISACRAGDLTPAPTADVPTGTSAVLPSITPLPTSTPTVTPTVVSITPQVSTVPAWVTDFSDPILVKLDGSLPNVHDEFTPLNRGWFYIIPGSRKNPFYAHQEDGVLQVRLPAENETKDYWVYNPRLNRRNFVLSFDFQFEETQPDDMARFQFDQTKDQSVALDLSKSKTWTLHWGPRADWQSITGVFDYLPPQKITILIIMQGEECAVYLNDTPLAYLSNCRTGSIVRSSPQAVTFHIVAAPGHPAAMTMDNVRLWDLDKIIK